VPSRFLCFFSVEVVRVPTLPLHLFSAVAAFFSAHLGKWLRPYRLPLSLPTFACSFLPNSSGPHFVLQDVFPALAIAPFGLHIIAARLCSSHRWTQPAGRTDERFRPHFPFSTRLPGDRKRIATNHSLSTTTQAARSYARECRLPAGRFDVSLAVDANLFVVSAICSRQSTSAKQISDWSVSRGA